MKIDFKNNLMGCKICDLSKTRTTVVLDDLRKETDIFILGEAPGGHEDTVSGKPFTGDAGCSLMDYFLTIGLTREDIYIGNAVKCRPVRPSNRGRYKNYANRRPKTEEIKKCSKWLFEEIELIDPKVIVAVGGVPLSVIMGKNVPIKEFHGKEIYWEKFELPVFVLYHPAAITYNPKLKDEYKRDIFKLKKFLEKYGLLNT